MLSVSDDNDLLWRRTMKAKRFFPAIAIAMILSLGACTDAVGPTAQNPDVAAVLETGDDQDTGSSRSSGQDGAEQDLEER